MAAYDISITTTDYNAWLEALRARDTRRSADKALFRAERWHNKTDDQLIEDALDVAKEDSLLQTLAFRLQGALERIDELQAKH